MLNPLKQFHCRGKQLNHVDFFNINRLESVFSTYLFVDLFIFKIKLVLYMKDMSEGLQI